MLSCRLEHVRCCQRSASAQVFQTTHWCFRSRKKDDETLSAPMRRILVLLWNKFKIFKMFPPQELILCAGFRSAAESSHPVSMLASVNHQWTVGVMWCHQLCRCLHLASSWRERERGFSLHDEHRDSHWSWSVFWTREELLHQTFVSVKSSVYVSHQLLRGSRDTDMIYYHISIFKYQDSLTRSSSINVGRYYR